MTQATIQKIIKLTEIPNADNIETAKVLGWDVVVRKGEFKEGDLCIYIEIDSLIPRESWSEFLFHHEEEKIYRLRTVKLRKQISQGLVVNKHILLDYEDAPNYLEPGIDLTDILGIKKYEKTIPAKLQGIIKGNFPHFIPKTDEERIQNDPELLDKLRGQPYYITTKLDGTSATFFKYRGKFGACSRKVELKDPNSVEGIWKILQLRIKKLMGKARQIPDLNVYWKMAEKYHIKDWLPDGYAIQGEICGPDIQKNPLGLKEPDFYIFNIFDIEEQRYLNLDRWDWILVCGNPDGACWCNSVPLEEANNEFNYTLEELLEKAKGKYPNTDHNREGIVVRSKDQSISFKVVNNDYLLKDEE